MLTLKVAVYIVVAFFGVIPLVTLDARTLNRTFCADVTSVHSISSSLDMLI